MNITKLKELRIQNGDTQKVLAEYLAIHVGAYSNKELGRRAFSLEEAYMVAKKYGTTIENIFFEETDVNKTEKVSCLT